MIALMAETLRLDLPEPHFTLFNSTREGTPAVIVVNEALLSFPRPDVFPWHLRVVLEASELIDNGMPSPDESKLLFEIGDEIEEAVLDGRTAWGATNALFLARSTWNGLRELLFQVHDPEIAHATLQSLLRSRDWARPWEYRMAEDADWQEAGYVFALFPLANGTNS